VALKNDGRVLAWGSNSYGETNVPIAAQSGVKAIAAGYFHTLALKIDGSVVAWGQNDAGQTNVPAGLSGVVAISAGYFHSVALKSDGSVVAWGASSSGQATVPIEAQSGVVAVAAGGEHTVALKNNGSVLTWGRSGSEVPAEAQSGVIAITAGSYHTVALKQDGSVVAWGDNQSGQATVPPNLSGVTAIAAGEGHTVVIVLPVAPTITKQPVSQTVNGCGSARFTVTATGFPLLYQWRKDGLDLAGATGPTHNLGLVQADQAGNYTVVVRNGAGAGTSAPPAVLTFDPAKAPVAGDLDCSFEPSVAGDAVTDGQVHAMAVQLDGKVLVGGDFYTVGGVSRNFLARLKADGTLDGVFLDGLPGPDSYVSSIALQLDGKIIIGGYFGSINGFPRRGLGRLSNDGALDRSFQDGLASLPDPESYVSSVAVQKDGKVLVGMGAWPGAVPQRALVRLNTDGTIDESFEASTDFGPVRAIALQSDDKILVGSESVFEGPPVVVARLLPNGILDSSFQTEISSSTVDTFFPAVVRSIALQGDGKVVIGGWFKTVDGVSRNSIARLNPNGSLDRSFQEGLGGLEYLHSRLNGDPCWWCLGAYSITVQSDGKLLVGGVFDTVNSMSRNSIARLNADGTLDTGFQSGLSGIESYLGSVFGGTRGVFSVAPQSESKVLVGGSFNTVNGIPAVGIARLWASDDATPRIRAISRSATAVNLTWNALSNRTYRVQYKDNLSASQWTDLTGEISTTGATATHSDATLGNLHQRFYRVLLLPQIGL
jgi:uncharacterized delta-60 repeat protein